MHGQVEVDFAGIALPEIVQRHRPSRHNMHELRTTSGVEREHLPWYAAQNLMYFFNVSSSLERVMSSGIWRMSSSSTDPPGRIRGHAGGGTTEAAYLPKIAERSR